MKLIMAVFLTTFVLAGCGASQKLSDQFDEATVKAEAERIIDFINNDDLEGYCSVPMSAKMKEATTVEAMQSVVDQYLSERGAFVKYKSNTVVGAKDTDGEDCAAAVIVAKYENQQVTYQISFNKNMEMIGFFLK